MPFGYENYRLKNGISPKTVVNEVSLIQSFLKYMDEYYNRSVAPHEIRPIDVRNFLDIQRKKPIKDSTVNRKLVYIRVWFNYMWEQGKIPVDFMEKFKYDVLDLTPKTHKITLNYFELLSKRDNVYINSEMPLNAKLFFLFDLRGMRRRDTLGVTIKDITDLGDELNVLVETRDGTATFNLTHPGEISVLLQAIERAVFRDTQYLFTVKKKDQYLQEQLSSSSATNKALAKVLGFNLHSEVVRFAYVHYLHIAKQAKLEEIQELLGTTRERAANILKEALVRVNNVDYNMQRTS